jgi:exonuclease SbcD
MEVRKLARILVIYGVHIKATTPVNRLDDYFSTTLQKLEYIINIANTGGYDMILCTGDLFDAPVVSVKTLLEVYKVFSKLKVPFHMPLGNHDIYGYNLRSYSRSSAKLLWLLCDKVEIYDDLLSVIYNGVEISFQPFCAEVDVNGYGYSYSYASGSILKIHVVHGMLMKSKPNFEPYTLISDVKTDADIVISGHDHIGYGVIHREDDVTFMNVGSLTRKTASVAEIDRIPKYCTLNCYSDGNFDVDVTEIPIAKPGDQILDRTAIEEKKRKEEIIEEFKDVLQESADFTSQVNLEALIISIGTLQNVKQSIVNKALDLIEKAREEINLEEI